MLKEHEEINKIRPSYNAKPKLGYSHGIYIHTSENGRYVLKPEKANGQENRLSSFNSLKATTNFLDKLVEEFKISSSDSIEDNNKKVTEIFEKYSINQRSLMLVDKGRALGEQSAIVVEKGGLKGVAYVELNHQLNNKSVVEKLITPMEHNGTTTYLIETYLRKSKQIKQVTLN